MTQLDMKTLETALETRARELARSLAERNQITIERAAEAFDESLLAAERESSARALAQDFQLLRQVEAARDRMRDGTFGVCLRCEDRIAPKRLQAIPWAAYCVSCQEKAEEGPAFRPGTQASRGNDMILVCRSSSLSERSPVLGR
jgi:DnaK suppressor protein